jgi:hypothetical protein
MWTPEPVSTTWWRDNSWTSRDSKSDPSVVEPVASLYIDWAIPIREQWIGNIFQGIPQTIFEDRRCSGRETNPATTREFVLWLTCGTFDNAYCGLLDKCVTVFITPGVMQVRWNSACRLSVSEKERSIFLLGPLFHHLKGICYLS